MTKANRIEIRAKRARVIIEEGKIAVKRTGLAGLFFRPVKLDSDSLEAMMLGLRLGMDASARMLLASMIFESQITKRKELAIKLIDHIYGKGSENSKSIAGCPTVGCGPLRREADVGLRG